MTIEQDNEAAMLIQIKNLAEKVDKLKNQAKFNEKNWRKDQLQPYAPQIGKENVSHQSSPDSENIGDSKFNSTLEGKFSKNSNQSQQSNDFQITDNAQNDFDLTIGEISYEAADVFIRQIKNELYFEQIDKKTGKRLLGLVDKKNENNYILRENVIHEKLLRLEEPFNVETVFGQIQISHFVCLNLFSNDIPFFVTDFLGNFDLVFGTNAIEIVKDIIDFEKLEENSKVKKEEEKNKKHECIESNIENEKLIENEQKNKIREAKIQERKTEIAKARTEQSEYQNIEKLNSETIKRRKVEELNIEVLKKIKTSKIVKTTKNIVPLSIQLGGKITKNTIEKLKLKFRSKLKLFRKKFAKGKSILKNVPNDFKFFEPG